MRQGDADPFHEVLEKRRAVREEMERLDQIIETAAQRMTKRMLELHESAPSIDPTPEELRGTSTAQVTVSTRWLATLCQLALDGELGAP